MRRAAVYLVKSVILVVLLAVVAGGLVVAFSPSVTDAQARVLRLARVHGATHVTEPVPALFAESIVASEDGRFYSEPGVDPIGVVRAAWRTVTGNAGDAGGATLSQQLAKWLYTDGHRGFAADVEQVALALRLNAVYSKAQLLQMYAGTVYFGHGYYGLYDAAKGYFGVVPARLDLGQASMLAGVVQAPSTYDPLTHPALARSRQAYVLGRLVADGTITAAQARRTGHAPLRLRPASAAVVTRAGQPGRGRRRAATPS